MEMTLAGKELENDPEDNPCFGCGPNNPIGLRLRFFDDGKVVRATLTLDERYGGSHTHVLQGIQYAAMDETMWWAAWARFGELPANATDGPTELRFPHTVKVGTPFTIEAEVLQDHGDIKDMRARIIQNGHERARLAWTLRRRTREEIEKGLARDGLERSIRDELTTMLARR